ncbi:pantetheine-phosphate adenylyltransferase [Litorilinea aerophila]|uniref:Phosphopantetheine adenylyltransferase n=1 Tax=Litorilinea aerophila TaxID=1204385 RepID=A0A540VHC6_9CHLR|nr:pantetheine-phosphate adenylyltransferase [Litorilinea aerophila]MCC9076212.1 pantetheine-phosphate adenylyltransferase [Litorilinea aerophila]GIV78912.1 MAG: phosphopantetheine adenylyltransferase [Litorilinea sp.]
MIRALYPGTFDPIHNGHIDIATRASRIFDEVVVAVYDAPPKKLLFTTEERVQMASAALTHLPNVSVISYRGLTVSCARSVDAQVIVRGLRNVADFEFEHQIGWANHQLAPEIELCCLFCNGEYANLSATILKEVASLGGDYRQWAPEHVRLALQRKFPEADSAALPNVVSRSDGKLSHHG